MTRFGGIAVLSVALVATPATARDRETRNSATQLTPYIAVSQVLTGDSAANEVLTYTQVSAGIDGHTSTRRIEAQISYRFDQRIAWNKNVQVDQIHSGLARVAVKVAPILAIEGGAIATRSRTDARGATAASFSGSGTNQSQIYSAYAGPTLTTQQGPFGIAASYRYSGTKVVAPTVTGVPTGAQPVDTFSSSRSQLAQASIGTKAGTFLPVGVSVSGAWQKENAGQLDQKYDGKFGRADVVAPILPTVAVVAGVGYEKITITQKDPVRDGVGDPVADSRGRYITDSTSPARIAYNTDGLFWDAGVIWRPSRRTTAQLRVGRRYDTMSYTASFSHQTGGGSGFQVGVYDSIQSFGRQLRDGVSSIPTNFTSPTATGADPINGCVFGSGTGSAGGCLGSAFQSITSSNYRARGVDAVFVLVGGSGTTIGFGGGYANRRYLAPSGQDSVDGLTDQSFYGQFLYSRQLGRTTSISATVYGNYAMSGLANSPDVLTAGASTSLSKNFGNLGTSLSLGAYTFDQKGVDSDVVGQAQVGMRYQF